MRTGERLRPAPRRFTRRRTAGFTRRRTAGFTLVGVVVFIAVLTILVAAIGPSVYAVQQRDKEEELIFRGRQYARAIGLFQRRFGRLPTSIKELEQSRPHTLRKRYKEPMCNCDEWHLIFAGTPEATPPGSGSPLLSLTPRLNLTPGFGSSPFGTTPNAPPSTYTGLFSTTPPPGAGGGAQQPTPEFPSLFGTPTTQTVGPIIGVRTSVHKKGFRQWRGLDYYDEWRFISGDADKDFGKNQGVIPGAPPPPGSPAGQPPTRR
jgi:type II secretory pathway pseudopilin PulG